MIMKTLIILSLWYIIVVYRDTPNERQDQNSKASPAQVAIPGMHTRYG
jgi:hypothetical protein